MMTLWKIETKNVLESAFKLRKSFLLFGKAYVTEAYYSGSWMSNTCLSNSSASAVEVTVLMSFSHLCAYYTQGISCQSQRKCKALSGKHLLQKMEEGKEQSQIRLQRFILSVVCDIIRV